MENVVFEYLLIISPEDSVRSRIMQLKLSFRKKYGCKNAHNRVPHITVLNFGQYEAWESKIISALENIAKTVSPMFIRLDGFKGYSPKGNHTTKDNNTIYIDVETKAPIVELAKRMSTGFRNLLKHKKGDKPHVCTDPHVTIAIQMTDDEYKSAIEEWKDEPFNLSFEAKYMTLLKRWKTKPFQEVRKFAFTGTNNKSYIQGSIFQDI